MAEFTTLEIAAMCERTERSVQRWLKEGRLPARHIQGNRYEVDENDLAPFLPHQKAEDYVRRLETLESRLLHVEQQLAALSSNKPLRPTREHSALSASAILPDGYVPLNDLLKQHNLTSKRKAVIRHMELQGKLKRGDWTLSGHAVNLALDPEGIAEFEKRYVRE